MAKKTFIDSISVPSPCDESWENMSGNDRRRHCVSCDKDVYNLSAMSRRDARRLLVETGGRICVRYAKTADGRLWTTDIRLHQITRRTAVAAGVLAVTVSLTTTAFSQGKPVPLRDRRPVAAASKESGYSSISFMIYDPNEAVIPGAGVILADGKKNRHFEAISDENGVARFHHLPFGEYELSASSTGFRTTKNNVRLLQEKEPDLKITLDVGFITGIIVTAWSDVPVFQAIAQGDNEAVKGAFDAGLPITRKDGSGNTALHVAVEHGNFAMVQYLLEKRANVNAKNSAKLTPIWLAEEIDDKNIRNQIIRLLVSKNADVNLVNGDKETLLMLAAEDDDLELVKLLLDAGANPNAKDEDDETAIEWTDSDEIKKLLISYGATIP